MTQLTIEPIPTGWRAFYDPEGLVGEGADREAAIVDLLEKTDELLGEIQNAAAEAYREPAGMPDLALRYDSMGFMSEYGIYVRGVDYDELRQRLSDVTRERDCKQEIISYVVQTLRNAFPDMDEGAPAEAIARKVAKRHAAVTRELADRQADLMHIREVLDAQPDELAIPALRRYMARMQEVTRERDEANKALEEAESERDTAVEALLAVRPYINMEAYVRIADEALKRGKEEKP